MKFFEYTKSHISTVEKEIEQILVSKPKNVYGMIFPFIKLGGKRIRPMLTILCCKVLGGDESHAIRPAALIEIFHNFTLIHDDIEDDSQTRRGEPTMHITHGIPIAINSGDALYTLLWEELLSLKMEPDRKLLPMLKLYASAFNKVVEGQGIELSWYRENNFDVSEQEYYDMIAGKTAALIGLSCQVGAYLAGVNEKEQKLFCSFGEKLGIAFQIYDDVLNVVGDFDKYQKEIGGDISEGKRSLMVVHCLKFANEQEKKNLKQILSSHTKDQEEIREAIQLLKKYGSVDYAIQKARLLIGEAKHLLRQVKDSEQKTMLLELCDYVISRDR